VNTGFTSTPVGTDDSEFCDLTQLKQRFGIGRSLAYLLIERGDITSKVLRRRGCIKGKRLIDVASVRQFISEQPDDIDPRLSAICKKANRKMLEKKEAEKVAAIA
jgi:hypothetical protein